MSAFKRVGWVAALLYVGTVFAANYAVQHFGFVPVGFGLRAPAGVYAAGLAFTLRDVVQDSLGRKMVVVAIVFGGGVSFLVSTSLAIASATAFLASEFADFAVYTPLRDHGRPYAALVLSNTVGLVFDSLLFLYLAFGSLQYAPGQMVGKAWMTLAAIPLIWGYRRAVLARYAPAVVARGG